MMLVRPLCVTSQMSAPRSLMAAYELVQMGFDNICVLKGGFTDWTKSGRSARPCCACGITCLCPWSLC